MRNLQEDCENIAEFCKKCVNKLRNLQENLIDDNGGNRSTDREIRTSLGRYEGDRLPTDGTDQHGKAENDKLLRAGREISKLSKLKTRRMYINNIDRQQQFRSPTSRAARGWLLSNIVDIVFLKNIFVVYLST